MVELRTRIREMWEHGGNHQEKLEIHRISFATQFTICDSSDIRHNPKCNNTDTKLSQFNQASCTPDFSYSLVFSISFSSLSAIALFLIHSCTIITEHEVISSLSIFPCHDEELTVSAAFSKCSIHQVQHSPRIVWLPFILIIWSWPQNVTSNFWHSSLHHRLSSASSPWQLKDEATLSHSQGCELTNGWIEC